MPNGEGHAWLMLPQQQPSWYSNLYTNDKAPSVPPPKGKIAKHQSKGRIVRTKPEKTYARPSLCELWTRKSSNGGSWAAKPSKVEQSLVSGRPKRGYLETKTNRNRSTREEKYLNERKNAINDIVVIVRDFENHMPELLF